MADLPGIPVAPPIAPGIPETRAVRHCKTKAEVAQEKRERDKIDARAEAVNLSTGHRMAIRALLASGLGAGEVAELEKLPRGVIEAIRDDATLTEATNVKWIDDTEKALAGRFLNVADTALRSLSPDDLKGTSAAQRVLLAATAVDKFRLMTGQPTAHISVKSLTMEVRERLDELRKQAAMYAASLDGTA